MRSKPWLALSFALLLTYVGYILWAKFAKIIGQPPIKLSETGEFWLFFASIVAFTIQVFVEDAVNDAAKAQSETDPGSQA